MKKSKFLNYKTLIHIFFILYALLCIVPFFLVVSISFSSEYDVVNYGFSLIPKHFDLSAYKQIFKAPETLLNGYAVTLFSALGGTTLNILAISMAGYALSRDTCMFKKPFTIYMLITMFVHGGLIPGYIIDTTVFHLGDNILFYLISGMAGAYQIFVFRTFFSGIPKSLIESAQLDGATEMQMLFKIIVPLSKPVIATFTFQGILGRWNDYSLCMYYMTDPKNFNLQYMLQQILNEANYLKMLKDTMPALEDIVIPSETLKFAMCVLAAGPMVALFPFFQKYFTKGMVVGAVKG